MSPFRKLAKLVRLRFGLPFVRRADRAREGGEWIEAVLGYRRGLEWLPWRQDLHVQIGNCLKEFGDYRGAMRAYAAVTEGSSLPEARKQAADADRRAGGVLLPFAIGATPDAAEVGRRRAPVPALSDRLLPNRIRLDASEPRGWLGPLGQEARPDRRLRGMGYATIKLDQVGAMRIERDGAQEPLLAGVVAVRGRIFSLGSPGAVVLRVGTGGEEAVLPVSLHPVPGRGPLAMHVFNAWIDAAALPRGRRWLAVEAAGRIAPAGLFVNVAGPADLPASVAGGGGVLADCDGFLPAPPHAPGGLDAAVAALPATARPAARVLIDAPVASVLALRVDQLGDVAASLPALARLRALFPAARLTVLAQAGVRAVVEASGLADEVLEIALSYDPVSERRRLDPAEEERLRALLAPRAPDLAIDLSPGDESRPLLLLTGATWLVGFNPDRFTFLDFGIAARSRDKVNGLDRLPHGATVLMLVEALAAAMAPARPVVPRQPGTAGPGPGLRPGGYLVLHPGARHAINRWPADRFAALAARLLAETPHDVVLFGGDDVALSPALPPAARARVHRFDLVDPDRFDAIVANARALVGNDSGPKHLAAVRGVPAVSIHVDRLNWNEWGQDGVGAIVSKRVPCTGCGLNDIALCGREAVCVRSITSDEVFAALRAFL